MRPFTPPASLARCEARLGADVGAAVDAERTPRPPTLIDVPVTRVRRRARPWRWTLSWWRRSALVVGARGGRLHPGGDQRPSSASTTSRRPRRIKPESPHSQAASGRAGLVDLVRALVEDRRRRRRRGRRRPPTARARRRRGRSDATRAANGPEPGGKVAGEALEGARACRGLRVGAADVLHVLTGHRQHQVGVGESADVELAAAVAVGRWPRARRWRRGCASSSACPRPRGCHAWPRRCAGTCRRGCARHHRPRGVAGAET